MAAEPDARTGHVAWTVRGKTVVWGGYTGKRLAKAAIEKFSSFSEIWQQTTCRGTCPLAYTGGAFASDSESLYYYGGFCNDSSFSCGLGKLDAASLEWSVVATEMAANCPMRKIYTAMGLFGDMKRLAVLGGFGFPTHPIQPGSTFVKSTAYSDGRGRTNEFHVYDLIESKL